MPRSSKGIARKTSIGVNPFVLGQIDARGQVTGKERKNPSGEYAYCDISFEKLREICKHPNFNSGGNYPCFGRGPIREFLKTMDYNLPIAKNTVDRLRKEAKIWKDNLTLQPGVAKKVQWSDTGAHLSMARVYSGRTTFFKTRKKVKVPAKQVCLLVTTALHGWSHPEEYYKIGLLAYQRAILAARKNIAMTILLCDPCKSATHYNNNYFFLTTPVIKGKKSHIPDNFLMAALPVGLAGYWGFSGECLNDTPGTGAIGLSCSISSMFDRFPKIKDIIEDKYGTVEIIDSPSNLSHSVVDAIKEDQELNNKSGRVKEVKNYT